MNTYEDLRAFLDTVPFVETHEHYLGRTEPFDDPFALVMSNYLVSDLEAAAGIADVPLLRTLRDPSAPFEGRMAAFEKLWAAVQYTGYGRGVARGFEAVWGIGIDRAGLQTLVERRAERTTAMQEEHLARHGLKAAVCNVGSGSEMLRPQEPMAPWCRFAVGVPGMHNLHRSEDVAAICTDIGAPCPTSLDEYLAALDGFVDRCAGAGFVCLKDQTAYRRDLAYGYPARAEAEAAFNAILSRPRDVVGDDKARALDDYLFHHLVRAARRNGLPVQIHTGHMAGIRNEITKTNAALLTPVLEQYRDVHFDLFHGNWPYLGEYLFLGKNYPNVSLDLCWVQCIDPLYAIELMRRAVVTVPTNKVLAFGGDTAVFEAQIGYLLQARDNVAAALSSLVDEGRMGADDAKVIAADWFYNNPNRVFGLGLEAFRV